MNAMSVRTEHVHVVVSICAETPPERIMTSMKAWATRRMVEGGLVLPGMRPWSRHGSTRYLWNEPAVASACRYVLDGQGAPL
jgi:REP element-mobilizing transposase RayT